MCKVFMDKNNGSIICTGQNVMNTFLSEYFFEYVSSLWMWSAGGGYHACECR